MKDIVTTLMERDNITKQEAESLVDDVISHIEEAMDDDVSEETLEEILMDDLRLEPDYLFELLDKIS